MDDLEPGVVEAVLERLGFEAAPAVDVEGLAALYRAWCRSVPFDNTLKLIALHGGSDGPLPGMDAESFFDSFLRHGTGGTCWPTANAIDALVRACGFESRVLAASMGDIGLATHGTTIVTLDERDWLVDSSMLTDEPLMLSADSGTAIEHPVFATSAEPVPEGWLFQFSLPYAAATMPCRTVASSGVTHGFCVERYDASREMSPFNHQPSTRRNDEEGVVSYGGGKRYRRTETGVEESDLSGSLVFESLIEEFGLSEEVVARLAAALGQAG